MCECGSSCLLVIVVVVVIAVIIIITIVVVIHLANIQRTKRAAARLVTHHLSHTHSCMS